MQNELKYYKIIKDNALLGVSSSYCFRKYQSKHMIILLADETDAQFIVCHDMFYHANWMEPVSQDVSITYETSEIIEISEDEYKVLEDIEDPIELPDEENYFYEDQQEPVDFVEEITLEYAKEKRIKEMSKQCNRAIIGGFDIVLSDGNSHHFSLTMQDQLNILSLTNTLSCSDKDEYLPYHADGELCRYFSANDMKDIIIAATNHRLYHISYFNSLRNYIRSLYTIEDVANIQYGDDVPVQYQSDVLKEILIKYE